MPEGQVAPQMPVLGLKDVYGLKPAEVLAAMQAVQQMRQAPIDEAYKRALTEGALAGAAQTRAQTGQMGQDFALKQRGMAVQERGMTAEEQRVKLAERSTAVSEANQRLQAEEFAFKKELETEMAPLRRAQIQENITALKTKQAALSSMDSVPVEIAPGQVISLGQIETISPGFASAFIKTQAAGIDEKGALTTNAIKQRMDQLVGRYSKNIGGELYGGFEEMKKQAAKGNTDAQAALQEYQELDFQYNAIIQSGRQKVKRSGSGGKSGSPPEGWKLMYKPGVGTFYLSPDGTQAWMNGQLVK